MISLKSAREIEIMRRANIIVAEGLQALKESVAPGVTTAELDRNRRRRGLHPSR